MKITLLTEFFYPDKASTGKILGELFSEVAKQQVNFEIDVICSSNLYRGRSEFRQHEVWDNITINRIQVPERLKRFRIIQAMVLTIRMFLFLFLRCVNAKKRPDVLIVITNPPFLSFASYLINKIFDIPYAYIIHDLYPDIAIATTEISKESIVTKVFGYMQKLWLNRAKKVIVLGRCMSAYIAENYSVNKKNIAIIHNWWNPIFKQISMQQKQHICFRILYAGNIGKAQDFLTLINAAVILQSRCSDTEIVIVGNGVKEEEVRQAILMNGLKNIEMHPFIEESELSFYFNSTDASLITLNKNVSGLAVPSKIYNIIRFSHPVIAIVQLDSEIANLINDYAFGQVVANGDHNKLADVIIDWSNNEAKISKMSKNAYSISHEFSLEIAASQFCSLLSNIGNG